MLRPTTGGLVDVPAKVLEKFMSEMQVLRPPFLQKGPEYSLLPRRENWKIVRA